MGCKVDERRNPHAGLLFGCKRLAGESDLYLTVRKGRGITQHGNQSGIEGPMHI